MAGWIGVDLDGTLAHFDRWRGPRHIGLPIPAMAKRVHDWHARGVEVRIFTARASRPELIPDVQDWLNRHGFPPLAVTNQKDFGMVELWDDRAIQVLYNTGKAVRPNHLQDVEKAELFDPDEDVVYADDDSEKTEIKPSTQEVEDFKRNIKASTDDSIDSHDDLLDALDDGDYAPGEAPDAPAAIQAAQAISAAQVHAAEQQPSDPLPEINESLLDSANIVSTTEVDLLTPVHSVVEIELCAEDMDVDADETQEIEPITDTELVEFAPLPVETKLDHTLDDQPVNVASVLDDLDDLDLESALDDVPDDLRSSPVNDLHDRPLQPPSLTVLPEDELDDYLDDLPAFRVERR